MKSMQPISHSQNKIGGEEDKLALGRCFKMIFLSR